MSTKIAMKRITEELQKEAVHSSVLGPKVLETREGEEEPLQYKDFVQGLGTLMVGGFVVFGPGKELILVEDEE